MAISEKVFEKFEKYLNSSSSVVELGNQTFTKECINKYNNLTGFSIYTPVKKYCEEKSIEHVSIDITGLDGSLPIDLNNKIDLNTKFDLVTNFGTTEHIEPNQYEPFLNIHNLCKKNGIMIHEVPAVGHWEGHCKFYYDEEFFEHLSNKNNYEILEIERINYGNVGDLLFVALKKRSDKFLSTKSDIEDKIHISDVEVNIPEYWKK